MRKILLSAAALFLFFATAAYADAKFHINAPGYTAESSDLEGILDVSSLSDLGGQDKFARAMFESAGFTGNVASLSSFQHYSLFSIMGGWTISAISDATNYDNAASQIEKEGDIYAGASTSAAINLGINASSIGNLLGLADNSFYVNFKFGGTPEMQYKDYRFKAYLIGAGFSMQLVDSADFIVGMWRGIAFNSGCYMNVQKSSLDLKYGTYSDGGAYITPELRLNTNAKIYTVPLEFSTALSFLFVNISVGGGADLLFGKGDVDVAVLSDVTDSSGTKVGEMSVSDAGVKGISPNRFNPKFFASAGLQFGPVKLELPVTYYPQQKGVSLGMSAGVVF